MARTLPKRRKQVSPNLHGQAIPMEGRNMERKILVVEDDQLTRQQRSVPLPMFHPPG